ncbi:MAG: hypothetical protein FK733_12505 [Asgard group archaeon]|nr:hypothetical protein [Asgard group archaeon]
MYHVKQEIIDWLLEDNNPPVKFLTMSKIIKKTDDVELDKVRSKINSYKPINEILQNQIENSYWFDSHKKHNYKKYLGSYWQLKFLGDMFANKNKQIENAIEHIFNTGQTTSGGFSYDGTNSSTIMCLTANMLKILIYFDYFNDDRTQNALEFILKNFADTNGKIRCQPAGLIPSCYMTLPKILHALSTIPNKDQTTRVEKGIKLCVERLLENMIYKYIPDKNREFLKANYKVGSQQRIENRNKILEKEPNMKKLPKKGWMKFGFPLSYASDALDSMKALVSANVKLDSNMQDALELIKSKATNGKWVNENKFKSPMYTKIDEYMQESKWITLHALEVLMYYEGLKIVD